MLNGIQNNRSINSLPYFEHSIIDLNTSCGRIERRIQPYSVAFPRLLQSKHHRVTFSGAVILNLTYVILKYHALTYTSRNVAKGDSRVVWSISIAIIVVVGHGGWGVDGYSTSLTSVSNSPRIVLHCIDPLSIGPPSPTPGMDIDRIFTAEQIAVHPDLPGIIKEYAKAVIRANPEDLLEFSLKYFENEVAKAADSKALA